MAIMVIIVMLLNLTDGELCQLELFANWDSWWTSLFKWALTPVTKHSELGVILLSLGEDYTSLTLCFS